IGMLPARNPDELLSAIKQARTTAARSFGSTDIYLERLHEAPRHIEFQFLADRHGNVRHLFERDCSVQRRHQKILEEAPAPGLSRNWVVSEAQRLGNVLGNIGYDVIGTVETLNSGDANFDF